MTDVLLIEFKNQCSFGHTFNTYHLPPDAYGIIHFATVSGRHAFILQEFDFFREQIGVYVRKQMSEMGVALSAFNEIELVEKVVEHFADKFQGLEPFYLWGRIPCPICGSKVRKVFAPVQPINELYVEKIQITFQTWISLDKKDVEVAKLINKLLPKK